MNRIRIALFTSVTLAALLIGGCPTSPPADNSNSVDNENSNTTANENSNSSTNENTNSTSNANSNDSGPSIIGAWDGTLNCERTQSLGSGPAGAPATSTKSLAITFGSDNKPTNIVVDGYSSVADQTVTLKNVGDTVTNNVSAGGYSGTMKMTISSATYQSDRCEIGIDIELAMTSDTNPGATQTGTGQQTITARTNSSAGLDYSSDSTYEVRLQVSSIVFDTTEVKTCAGTLAK